MNYIGSFSSQSAYENWFSSMIENYLEVRGLDVLNGDATQYLYFMTMTFNGDKIRKLRRKFNTPLETYDIEMDNFHRLYKHILKRIYGRHFHRQKYASMYPLAIASVDFGRSRVANASSLSRANAHIHALWAVNPIDAELFNSVISSARFRLKFVPTLHVDTIQFKKVVRGSRIGDVASYSVKSHIKTNVRPTSSQLLRIYPQHLDLPLAHSYEPWDGKLFKLQRDAKKHLKSILKDEKLDSIK